MSATSGPRSRTRQHPSSCTDTLWARRLKQFQASAHPIVYTPGDNDWTDCHPPRVPGYDPLERLPKLRALFFPSEQSLGKRTIPLTRQSLDPAFATYRENARWTRGGVAFVTVHVVGSNNGWLGTDGGSEFKARNDANVAWLRAGFAFARDRQCRALMIFQQANI